MQRTYRAWCYCTRCCLRWIASYMQSYETGEMIWYWSTVWSAHIITSRSNTQYLCNPLHKTPSYGRHRMDITLYLCEFKIMNSDKNNLWMSLERMTSFENTVCATHMRQCSLQHKNNRRKQLSKPVNVPHTHTNTNTRLYIFFYFSLCRLCIMLLSFPCIISNDKTHVHLFLFTIHNHKRQTSQQSQFSV